MGYYCTVPQCTSLAGKTKNVKFHRFPRDVNMADKWNVILKRGKPYTKYSKVCSLHFTQADYNVTTMGHFKTLSKDAVPSQNLPKLNPDGSVMVIRKSRAIKYKDGKKDDLCDKSEKWLPISSHGAHGVPTADVPCTSQEHDSILAYRLQTLGAIANNIAPHTPQTHNLQKPKKQDAFMQTDPILNEDDDTQPNNSYSEVSDKSYNSEVDQYGYPKDNYQKDNYQKDNYPKDNYPKDNYGKDQKDDYPKDGYSKESYQEDDYPKDNYQKDNYEKDNTARDYTKTAEDYIPQTNEEYNKEAEKYALERKSHFDLKEIYQKQIIDNYQKLPDVYYDKSYNYQSYQDSAEILRNQQQNLQLLQEQHRLNENQNFFNENHIKQEIDISVDDDKYNYDANKDDGSSIYSERRINNARIMEHIQPQVKQEPDANNVCDVAMQPQGSPYYQPNAHNSVTGGYYEVVSRPGPELLIAKQNALAAHTELWQNMKRPFYYSENTHYTTPQIFHRCDDIPRIVQ